MAAVAIHHIDVGSSEQSEQLISSHPLSMNAVITSPSRRLQLHTWSITFALVFLVELSGGIGDTPWLRICESIVCHDYYKVVDPSVIGQNGAIEEKHCKINPVQEDLALLVGWTSFFGFLPGLFLAIPYGVLADKYGRRWLMVMNITSMCCRHSWSYIVFSFPNIFPIRMLWLQGAFAIFGGGGSVTSTLFHVVLTDVTPESQRSTVFCYAYALVFLTYFVGPPISSVLMDRNPWIPLGISVCLMFLSLPVVLALPETLQATESRQEVLNSRRTADMVDPYPEPSPTFKAFGQPTNSKFFNRTTTLLVSVFQDSRFLLEDWRIMFLMSTTLAYIFADLNSSMLSQYVSKRYSWQLSKTAYLTSFRGAISVLTLLVFLPGVSACLLKTKRISAFEKDIKLSQISFTLITVGGFVVAFSPSIPIFIAGYFVATLGSGTDALVRSSLAGLVKPAEVARLFSVMSILSTMSILVSQPLKASLYTWGLKHGGAWVGMPFIVCAIIMGLSTVSFWVLRLDGRIRLAEEESSVGRRDEEDEEDDLFIPVARDDLPLRNYE